MDLYFYIKSSISNNFKILLVACSHIVNFKQLCYLYSFMNCLSFNVSICIKLVLVEQEKMLYRASILLKIVYVSIACKISYYSTFTYTKLLDDTSSFCLQMKNTLSKAWFGLFCWKGKRM